MKRLFCSLQKVKAHDQLSDAARLFALFSVLSFLSSCIPLLGLWRRRPSVAIGYTSISVVRRSHLCPQLICSMCSIAWTPVHVWCPSFSMMAASLNQLGKTDVNPAKSHPGEGDRTLGPISKCIVKEPFSRWFTQIIIKCVFTFFLQITCWNDL